MKCSMHISQKYVDNMPTERSRITCNYRNSYVPNAPYSGTMHRETPLQTLSTQLVVQL